jgi:diguanylate cyclase (GGDEF)-like protein
MRLGVTSWRPGAHSLRADILFLFRIVYSSSRFWLHEGGVVLKDRPANDDEVSFASRGEAALREEITLLRSALCKCASRISELEQLAYVDPLVSLPNRRHFLGKLDAAIAQVRGNGGNAAVLFLDLDGLKEINDNFGHEAGDLALVEVGRLLTSSVRNADFVARLSGDEFAVLLEGTDEHSTLRMAERVVDSVDHFQFCVGNSCLELSVAIGVTMIKPDDTAREVLGRADSEMYRVKAIGRGAIR